MKKSALFALLAFLLCTFDAKAQYFSGSYGTSENINAEVGLTFDMQPATFRTFVGYEHSSKIGNMVNIGVGAEKELYKTEEAQLVTLADIRLSGGDMVPEMNSRDEFAVTGIGDIYGGIKLPFENVDLYMMTGFRATPYDNFHYYWIPFSMRISIR